MKIEQSAVELKTCHSFTSQCEVKFDSEINFRTIYDGVTQTDATSTSGETNREFRVLLMLETLIARMLEFISGARDTKVTDLREILKTDDAELPDTSSNRRSRSVEMEVKSEFTEKISEHESTDFSSKGCIRTTDGRSLDFKLDLAMCRDFECERKVTEVHKAVLRDPLVINFDGKAAELSGRRFEFDLEGDGESEAVYALGNGSGYLAIDSNADGQINDGRELFGTLSGDGFADLAKLDCDGNHWLDESDAAYGTLRIWQHDASGQDSLSTLQERGVGALYLGSTETPFTLTDSENRTLAQIRATGLYLGEDGSVGSLQQIDLAV